HGRCARDLRQLSLSSPIFLYRSTASSTGSKPAHDCGISRLLSPASAVRQRKTWQNPLSTPDRRSGCTIHQSLLGPSGAHTQKQRSHSECPSSSHPLFLPVRSIGGTRICPALPPNPGHAQ